MISGRSRLVLLVWAGAFAFASLVTVGLLLTVGFERSPFLLMTSPYVPAGDIGQPFIGYSMVIDDGGAYQQKVVHKENTAAMLLARKLVGGQSSVSLYDGRVMLPFLASSVLWLTGSVNALLLVNAFLWSIAILAGFLLGRDVSKSNLGGYISGSLVALGSGYWFHALDLSAHLAAFSTYAVAAYAIYRSSVWQRSVGWRVHAFLAAILAIACSTYNSGIMVLAVYVAVAVLGRNKLLFVALAAASALAFQYAWLPLMSSFGFDPKPITDTERQFLTDSLQLWSADLQQRAFPTLIYAASLFRDFLLYEPAQMGLLVALVVIYVAARAFKIVEGRIDWRLVVLVALLVAMPALMSVPWARSATARGYLGYPGSIGVYIAIASLLVALVRVRGRLQWTTFAVAGAAVVVHASILFSAVAGNLAPLRVYFYGGVLDGEYVSHFVVPPDLDVIPLTGGSIPQVAGGSFDFGLAASNDLSFPMDDPPSFDHTLRTLTWRTYAASPFLILTLILLLSTKRRSWVETLGGPLAVAVGLIVIPVSLSPPFRNTESIRGFFFDSIVDASKANALRYDIALSESAATTLRDLAQKNGAIEFAFKMPPATKASIFLGENEIATGAFQRVPAASLAAAEAGDVLSLRYIRSDAPIGYLPGYRPSSTPGGQLIIDGETDVARPFFPFLEIRGYARAQGGWPLFVAF